MGYTFLSYSRSDRDLALTMEAALACAGLSVWWDDLVDPRQPWDLEIERKICEADHVLVLWTPASVRSESVRDEAYKAKSFKPSKLIQARLDGCEIPLGFNRIQYVDLPRERPDEAAEWSKLIRWLTPRAETEPSAPVVPEERSADRRAAAAPAPSGSGPKPVFSTPSPPGRTGMAASGHSDGPATTGNPGSPAPKPIGKIGAPTAAALATAGARPAQPSPPLRVAEVVLIGGILILYLMAIASGPLLMPIVARQGSFGPLLALAATGVLVGWMARLTSSWHQGFLLNSILGLLAAAGANLALTGEVLARQLNFLSFGLSLLGAVILLRIANVIRVGRFM